MKTTKQKPLLPTHSRSSSRKKSFSDVAWSMHVYVLLLLVALAILVCTGREQTIAKFLPSFGHKKLAEERSLEKKIDKLNEFVKATSMQNTTVSLLHFKNNSANLQDIHSSLISKLDVESVSSIVNASVEPKLITDGGHERHAPADTFSEALAVPTDLKKDETVNDSSVSSNDLHSQTRTSMAMAPHTVKAPMIRVHETRANPLSAPEILLSEQLPPLELRNEGSHHAPNPFGLQASGLTDISTQPPVSPSLTLINARSETDSGSHLLNTGSEVIAGGEQVEPSIQPNLHHFHNPEALGKGEGKEIGRETEIREAGPIFKSQVMIPTQSLYNFTAIDIDGLPRSLSSYHNKVIIVVNVASACGFTDSNYRGLVALYNHYNAYGVEILAFPCNQFGGQEPGSDSSIKQFAKDSYGVSFPMFSKVEVNGPSAHPLFKWLKKMTPKSLGGGGGVDPGSDLTWNFNKFIIDRAGWPRALLRQDFDALAVEGVVRQLLAESYDEAAKRDAENEGRAASGYYFT
uniref:Glutathione peroxidase n=1 Tax=Polytomella parva TaxID=51329 RepID=A0A7S0URV7_9CHLO|mmetsp:Transcript_19362/g.34955  ORF Transcript_19362/g.34955 Transcript_19362/m.34955 type:complete len:518 (+) Transcript_19362:58-1611(+)